MSHRTAAYWGSALVFTDSDWTADAHRIGRRVQRRGNFTTYADMQAFGVSSRCSVLNAVHTIRSRTRGNFKNSHLGERFSCDLRGVCNAIGMIDLRGILLTGARYKLCRGVNRNCTSVRFDPVPASRVVNVVWGRHSYVIKLLDNFSAGRHARYFALWTYLEDREYHINPENYTMVGFPQERSNHSLGIVLAARSGRL